MKSLAHLREHSWLTICIVALLTVFSVGCTSSRRESGATTNPLAAYDSNNNSNPANTESVINGTTVKPGSLTSPIISVTGDGSTSIEGHDNAPLLTNTHAGWQQSSCLTCHNETTNNPDHNYTDDTLCYLCHGTNGLPGFNDSTPPVLSAVSVNPTDSSVTIGWKSDEECVSRLILKTIEGDRMEFPVSTTYTTSHRYTVNGLQSATTYYYELICTDKSGNKTTSSSFSSAMTFVTNPKVIVTNPSPSNPEENPEESEAFISNLSVDVKSNDKLMVTFDTLSVPAALYFYIYKVEGDADYDHDKINIRVDNHYQSFIDFDRPIPAGKYYLRIKYLKDTSSKFKESKKASFTVK